MPKLTPATLLRQYDELATKLNAAKQKHGIDMLETQLADVESELKSLARTATPEQLEKAQTEHFFVEVARPFKKYYVPGIVRNNLSEAEWNIVADRCLKEELDSKEFEALVKSGAIPREVQRKAFREEPQTPRVSIKANK